MTTDLREQLTDLQERLARMDGDRLDTMAEAASLARKAREAGVPISEIARLLGFSRPTIYSLLSE